MIFSLSPLPSVSIFLGVSVSTDVANSTIQCDIYVGKLQRSVYRFFVGQRCYNNNTCNMLCQLQLAVYKYLDRLIVTTVLVPGTCTRVTGINTRTGCRVFKYITTRYCVSVTLRST